MVNQYDSQGELQTGRLEVTNSQISVDSDSEWNNSVVQENVAVANNSIEIDVLTEIIDNLEPELYEDQGNTLSDYYGGDLAGFTRQDTTVLEGTTSLEGETTGTPYSISSTAGLPKYPAQGETWRYRCKSNRLGSIASAGTFVEFGWFTQSETSLPNEYGVQIRSNDEIAIIIRNSGLTTLQTAAVTVEDNTEYEVEVSHDLDGNINVSLYDDPDGDESFDNELASASVSGETTWTSGGISWGVNESDGGTHTAQLDYGREGNFSAGPAQESWADYRTYNANNPLITPSDNPDAGDEQYALGAIEKPNGGYALYCKSDELESGTETVLQLWESTDGVDWTLQSTELGPSDVTPSDAIALTSPGFVYDPGNSTYYLWTRLERSNNPNEVWRFTGSSHDSLTEADNNPVVSVADFGFADADWAILQDCLKYNGTRYAYGTYGPSSGGNRCWYGTFDSDSWGATITPQAEILTAANDYQSGDVVQGPQVFQRGDGDFMAIMAVGTGSNSDPASRQTYTAVGSDPTSFTTYEDLFVDCKSSTWRSRWAYSGSWIKVNGQGNRDLQTFNGNYRFYMNGQPTNSDNNGSIGLAEFSDIPALEP